MTSRAHAQWVLKCGPDALHSTLGLLGLLLVPPSQHPRRAFWATFPFWATSREKECSPPSQGVWGCQLTVGL